MLRIVSLNLNGIRSATTKGVWSWLGTLSPDVLAVQELKAQAADLDDAMRAPEVSVAVQGTFITR
jgi:exodeoxyribonuclease-3